MKTTNYHFASRTIFLLTSLLILFTLNTQAQEAPSMRVSFAANANQPINIDLLVGQSKIIELDEGHDSSHVTMPGVVQITPLTLRTVVISAVSAGQVNVHILKVKKSITEPDQVLVFHVYVQKNLTQIDSSIKLLYPKENIQLSQINDSIIISGSVTAPEIAENVEKILKSAGAENKVINLLQKPAPITMQVSMQVRIAEVNRSVLRELGAAYGILNSAVPAYISPGGPANFAVTNGASALSPASTLINLFLGRADRTSAFINALNTRGAIRELAEPNIIVSNKQKGSFLAGGEVPIPIVNSVGSGQGGITVSYKPYGVKLDFMPTIIDEDHITVELEPEVSGIDSAQAIKVSGFDLPAFRVRRAKTTLELRDGQSFALAGLIDNSESVNYSHIPGVGNLPIIGELFKSRRFQRNETELVFLCTVKITTPLNPDQIPRLPGAPLNNLPAQPENKATNNSGAALTPFSTVPMPAIKFPTTGLLEGASGHALPRKEESVKANTKSDNEK